MTEKVLDSKRRITVPSSVGNLKQDSKVALVTLDKDAVIIASTKEVAQELASLFREASVKRKLRALDEWEDLVKKAGLSDLTTEEIDHTVEKEIRRPREMHV